MRLRKCELPYSGQNNNAGCSILKTACFCLHSVIVIFTPLSVTLRCSIHCHQEEKQPPSWGWNALRADTCVGEQRWKPFCRASFCPDQKAWGAAQSAATGPLSCCFLVVSLGGRGSKLVTVSFRLQSRAFSSCSGGWIPCWGRKSLPPSPELPFSGVYRLQRAAKRLVEAVIFHTSFPLRELSVDPHTLPLPLPLSSISNVSHLFLWVVSQEESIK